jgi:GTPase involved in cell partitioning and DNA repair
LKKHNPELIKRPSLLLLTKTDLIPEKSLKVGAISREIQIIQISSATGKNLNEAIQSIAMLIKSQTHVSKIPSD